MPSCSVRVICRFRPVNKREQEEALKSEEAAGFKLVFEDSQNVLVSNGKQSYNFSFDRIFPSDSHQPDVYEITAKPTVEDVLAGYNGTIFAYGQTGAGKTYTMFGPDKIEKPDDRGIVPRTSAHIFEHIDSDASKREYAIKCSFLEIYKEVVKDLLNPKNVDLKIRESPQKGVWVDGLTEEFVTSEQDIADLIAIGDNAKSVSSTAMNHRSSRSHSLFMIIIEQKEEDGTTKVGKLNLVDLAGSEKIGKTGATGQTLEEAKKINQSLSALGNCIHALTESHRGHIPYRDSTLTRILQESLGGNTKTTLMIAASPHPFNVEETIGTLMFGKRAKTIKNTVKVNKQKSATELAALIQAMRKELLALQEYNLLLEKQIEWMKAPDYDPSKPLPKELVAPKIQARPETPTRGSQRSGSVSAGTGGGGLMGTTPPKSGGMHTGAGSAANDGTMITLDMARAELQKLREASSLSEGPSNQLRKDLAVLQGTDEENNQQAEKNKQKLRLINEEIDAVLKQTEDSKKQHAAELKKLEKEKNEKKREVTDLVSSIQEITQQNHDLNNSITEGEDSILLIYTDNQMAVEESVKVREELIARKKALDIAKEKHAIAEKEGKSAIVAFEHAKERGLEIEERKKAIQTSIEHKETELQGMQVEFVKVGADIEIEERKIAPLEHSLKEKTTAVSQLKFRIEEVSKTVTNINVGGKLEVSAKDVRLAIRESLLRTYALCSNLLTAGKPDAALQARVLGKLKDDFQLSEDDVKKMAKTFDDKSLLDGLANASNAAKMHENTTKDVIGYLETALQEATSQHKELIAKIDDLNRKNSEMEKKVSQLNKNVETSRDESLVLRRTILEASTNSESIYNKSKSISSSLETLSNECDSLRLALDKSRKATEGFRFSSKDRSANVTDLKSKIATEEDTRTRISTLLIKETKRVGSETITAALQQKRIDEQKKRITEIEEELAGLTQGLASMQARKRVSEAEIGEFEQHIIEEDKLLAEAQAEIMNQKLLRLEQLKRNRKVFKPVLKRGMLRALEEKIDLSEKKTKLRATASPFLKAAAEEHERSQSKRG